MEEAADFDVILRVLVEMKAALLKAADAHHRTVERDFRGWREAGIDRGGGRRAGARFFHDGGGWVAHKVGAMVDGAGAKCLSAREEIKCCLRLCPGLPTCPWA